MLISGYLAGGPQAGADRARARAEALIRGWLKNVPIATATPATSSACPGASQARKWIDDQIAAGVNYLATHWQGPWNHGLVQDLKLMQIGCAYPATGASF